MLAENSTHTTINFNGYQITLLEYSLIRCICFGSSFDSLSLPHHILCSYQMTVGEWVNGIIGVCIDECIDWVNTLIFVGNWMASMLISDDCWKLKRVAPSIQLDSTSTPTTIKFVYLVYFNYLVITCIHACIISWVTDNGVYLKRTQKPLASTSNTRCLPCDLNLGPWTFLHISQEDPKTSSFHY